MDTKNVASFQVLWGTYCNHTKTLKLGVIKGAETDYECCHLQKLHVEKIQVIKDSDFVNKVAHSPTYRFLCSKTDIYNYMH